MKEEEVELRTFENDIVDWRIRKNYSKGKLSKRLEYEKSRLVKINVYEYDEYGSEVKNSLHDKKSGEKKITTSEYKYDKNGNWLERRRYESGNLISLITQEIELYNL